LPCPTLKGVRRRKEKEIGILGRGRRKRKDRREEGEKREKRERRGREEERRRERRERRELTCPLLIASNIGLRGIEHQNRESPEKNVKIIIHQIPIFFRKSEELFFLDNLP
jgi:hypothetical protein